MSLPRLWWNVEERIWSKTSKIGHQVIFHIKALQQNTFHKEPQHLSSPKTWGKPISCMPVILCDAHGKYMYCNIAPQNSSTLSASQQASHYWAVGSTPHFCGCVGGLLQALISGQWNLGGPRTGPMDPKNGPKTAGLHFSYRHAFPCSGCPKAESSLFGYQSSSASMLLYVTNNWWLKSCTWVATFITMIPFRSY